MTVPRLEAFADASREDQLAVLTHLRVSAAENNIWLSLVAVALAVIFPIAIALSPVEPIAGSLEIRTIVLGIVGLFLGVGVLLGVGVPALIDHFKTARAVAWLRAYEDELDRRTRQGGRAGRRWRSIH